MVIFVHLPNVANRSSCCEIIYSFVMIKASGLICGGKFTPEAIDLNAPANLLTVSNFSSIYLKYSEQPSNLAVNGSG